MVGAGDGAGDGAVGSWDGGGPGRGCEGGEEEKDGEVPGHGDAFYLGRVRRLFFNSTLIALSVTYRMNACPEHGAGIR